MLAPGLKSVLSCPEGQEALITAEFLRATDIDSPDDSLLFLVARQPRHGAVLCGGRVVDRFVQAEVAAGTISYRHDGESPCARSPVRVMPTMPRFAGQEVGLTPCHDTVTFVISDEGKEGGGSRVGPRNNLPVYDLHITVFPVDSQPPSLSAGEFSRPTYPYRGPAGHLTLSSLGEVFSVDEGGVAPITALHLRASDKDTPLDELLVSLIHPPQFGYVENVLPSPGFEKSNMGISIGKSAATTRHRRHPTSQVTIPSLCQLPFPTGTLWTAT